MQLLQLGQSVCWVLALKSNKIPQKYLTKDFSHTQKKGFLPWPLFCINLLIYWVFFFFVFPEKIKFQSKLVSVTVFFFVRKTRLSDGIFPEIVFACDRLTKFEKTCLNDRISPKIFCLRRAN